MATCARCGETFDEAELLFHDRGRICEGCELDLEEDRQLRRGLWTTVLSGPITALAGTVFLCVPVVGFLGALALGAMALWRGAAALQVAWLGREDADLGAREQAALWVSGGITTLWAIGLVLSGGASAVWLLVRAVTG